MGLSLGGTRIDLFGFRQTEVGCSWRQKDAFRAANYTEADRQALVAELKSKIMELSTLPYTSYIELATGVII